MKTTVHRDIINHRRDQPNHKIITEIYKDDWDVGRIDAVFRKALDLNVEKVSDLFMEQYGKKILDEIIQDLPEIIERVSDAVVKKIVEKSLLAIAKEAVEDHGRK